MGRGFSGIVAIQGDYRRNYGANAMRAESRKLKQAPKVSHPIAITKSVDGGGSDARATASTRGARSPTPKMKSLEDLFHQQAQGRVLRRETDPEGAAEDGEAVERVLPRATRRPPVKLVLPSMASSKKGKTT